MGDSELDMIRAQRMAQMQGQQGGGGGGEQEEKQSQEDRQAQAEQMKNQILTQVLDQQARARLNTLMVAKPEKGQMVENMLINMARSGQLRGKLGETELIGLLEQINQRVGGGSSGKVKFDRRRTNLDDDDDDLDL